MPRAIVIGCGRIGSTLAQRLLSSGWDVVVVDRDEQAFLRLGDDWRGRIVQGHAFDVAVLEEAGIADADALLAVTSGDNTNVVVAQVATGRYGVRSVAARILDPGRADFYENRGFAVVSPAKDAIETLSAWSAAAGGAG